uniref:Iodothyronine deiodinase n=1 Tax=Periophthalmus magnuspinnatus TaxID=409849 RepID=A0A3B4AVM9_9GOBI
MFGYMVSLNLTLRIIYFVSPNIFKKVTLSMGKKLTMTQNPNFTFEDWGLTFMSLSFIKTVSHILWLSMGQEAFEGGAAPDSPVITMEGQESSILKFMKNRPLVLNFGSCTPPFMYKLGEFKELVQDFSDVADFLVVYIAEAHSSGWAFTNNYDIKQHQGLEDRLSAARILFQKDPPCPVVVDEMSNCTTIKYGALPDRMYVLQAGKVIYKGEMGPWGYDPLKVRAFLEKMK